NSFFLPSPQSAPYRDDLTSQCDIGVSSPLKSPWMKVCPPQSAGRGSGLALPSTSSKLTTMMPPLRKVIVSEPGVLLAAMIASRRETRPSAPGRSLIGPVPQGPSASNGGSAISVRVVTTMGLAAAGEARPPRTRQQAMPITVIKLVVVLCGCITVLLFVYS